MRTVQDYIAIIRQNSSKITKDFGIKTLRIFGSVSRNEQKVNPYHSHLLCRQVQNVRNQN